MLDKRKTNRRRKIPLIRFFIFLAVALLAMKALKSNQGTETASEASIVPLSQIDKELEQRIEKPLTEYLSQFTHVVKPGETFYGILTEFEVSLKGANDVYQSLKPLGFPALFPGDSLVINRDSSGVLQKLELLSKCRYRYQVCCSDSSIMAQKCSLTVSTYTCMVNGVLETSLSEHMNQFGVSDAITSKFADIFAWDINFFLDPRKGDKFQILFEKKYAEGKFVGYGDVLAARYVNGQKEFLAFGLKDSEGRIKYYDANGKSVQKQFLKAPLSYSRISSGFTFRRKHPVLGYYRPHLGVDYAAPRGTPVYASADGKVSFSGRKGDFGNLVILTHGGAYETYYGHLHTISSKARSGMYVKQGDLIGTVGSTGMSTGPHLDYRMKRSGNFVNPASIIMPSNSSVESARKAEFEDHKNALSASFELRFPGRQGLYVLEINTPESGEPQVHQVIRTTYGGDDGGKSGS